MDSVTGGFREHGFGRGVLGVGRGAADVRFEEEAHEEQRQGSEVNQIEVDGKSLARGVNAGNVLVLCAIVSAVLHVVDGVLGVLNCAGESDGGGRCVGSIYVLCKTLIASGTVDPLLQESKGRAGGDGDGSG